MGVFLICIFIDSGVFNEGNDIRMFNFSHLLLLKKKKQWFVIDLLKWDYIVNYDKKVCSL